MSEAGEIARFHDRCSDLMRELLDELADAPDRPRTFPEIEDTLEWPRRRIASVLGGVSHLRHTEFGGRRPYRFHDGHRQRPPAGRCGWMPPRRGRCVLHGNDNLGQSAMQHNVSDRSARTLAIEATGLVKAFGDKRR